MIKDKLAFVYLLISSFVAAVDMAAFIFFAVKLARFVSGAEFVPDYFLGLTIALLCLNIVFAVASIVFFLIRKRK